MNSSPCWSVFIPLRPSQQSTKTITPLNHPKRPYFPPRSCAPPPDPASTQTPQSDLKPQVDSNTYFERLRTITQSETALSNPLGLRKSYEVVSFDANGTAPLDRFVYVEERDCIGCTHCATTANDTFFMEPEHGRARVFNQTGDAEKVVQTAIETCPVSCIYYVDWNDLVTLEDMRENQVINNSARLVGAKDNSESRVGVKRTLMDSGIMQCGNCPMNGCSTCPMYGVGNNPEYLRKKRAREAAQKLKGPEKKVRRRL